MVKMEANTNKNPDQRALSRVAKGLFGIPPHHSDDAGSRFLAIIAVLISIAIAILIAI